MVYQKVHRYMVTEESSIGQSIMEAMAYLDMVYEEPPKSKTEIIRLLNLAQGAIKTARVNIDKTNSEYLAEVRVKSR